MHRTLVVDHSTQFVTNTSHYSGTDGRICKGKLRVELARVEVTAGTDDAGTKCVCPRQEQPNKRAIAQGKYTTT